MPRSPRASSDASPLMQVLHRFRLAIGVLLLALLGTIGWFAEDILAWFESKPTPTAIAGAWTMDEAQYAATIAELITSMPEEQGRDLKARLTGLGTRFSTVVYTFRDDGYDVTRRGTTITTGCTYVGVAPNVLIVQPTVVHGPGGMTLILDLEHQHLFIGGQETAIPLMRVP